MSSWNEDFWSWWGQGREKCVFSQIQCAISWESVYVRLVGTVGSLIFRFSKSPWKRKVKEELQLQSLLCLPSKKVSRQLFRREGPVSSREDPGTQTAGSWRWESVLPSLASSRRLSLGSWDSLSSLSTGPSPCSGFLCGRALDKFGLQARYPCRDIPLINALIACPRPPKFSQGLSYHFPWFYLFFYYLFPFSSLP